MELFLFLKFITLFLTRRTKILNTSGQVFITGNIELAKCRSNYAIKELNSEFIS